MQEKVHSPIPVTGLLSLPNKKDTYDHFKLTAAIEHKGMDFQSGHYVVHLVDLDNTSVMTVDVWMSYQGSPLNFTKLVIFVAAEKTWWSLGESEPISGG